MEKIDKDTWSLTLQFLKGEHLEYKFTKGSWEKEAVREDGEIPQNSVLEATQDTTVVTVITNWKDEFEYGIERQITGTVKYHRDVQGEGLKPRDIIVWLPPDYEKDENIRYPVLYMHDGQNIIDPQTSFLRIEWQIDEVADSLIRKDEIEPIIIVCIYNTSDRNQEYSPYPLCEAYMRFVVKTVKPLIDKTYRTIPDREHTTTGGSSIGRLISFILVWEYPHVFSQAACLSPAFKIDETDYVTTVEQYKGPKNDVKISIDNGGVGLEARLQPGIDNIMDITKPPVPNASGDRSSYSTVVNRMVLIRTFD